MEKSILEQRIEEKAEERFNEEFKSLMTAIERNEVGKRLFFKASNDQKVKLTNNQNGTRGQVAYLNLYGIYNEQTKKIVDSTNIEEVKEAVLKQYIAEETDNILNKLQDLKHLF